MKPVGIEHFLSSPFARRPSLLLGKIAKRTGLARELVWQSAPVSYRPPAHLRTILLQWIADWEMAAGPISPTFLFGREWDESFLWRLCETGERPAGRGLEAESKLPWEFSRAHHLPQQAVAALRQNRVEETAKALARWVKGWLEHNPFPHGVNWQCAMEVAIRAMNWIATDALMDGALASAVGESQWRDALWNHGRCIRDRLEVHFISSNHYLADLCGLAWLSAAFPDGAESRKWRVLVEAELFPVLGTQIRPDGGAFEASTAYHVLYVELSLLAVAALGGCPSRLDEILQKMSATCAAVRRANGKIWTIGDDDDGRVLRWDPLFPATRVDQVLALARVLLGKEFSQSSSSRASLYPDSGWWTARLNEWAVCVAFGGVGFKGWGGHAHNDRLSVCVDDGLQPVLIDAGTYAYTSDPAKRKLYRSAGMHNTMMIDGLEHRPFPTEKWDPFLLRGSDSPADIVSVNDYSLELRDRLPARGSPVTVRRGVALEKNHVAICDRIEGAGQHRVSWNFLLAPELNVHSLSTGWVLKGGGHTYKLLSSIALSLSIEPSVASPAFGVEVATKSLKAEWEGSLPLAVEWRLERA